MADLVCAATGVRLEPGEAVRIGAVSPRVLERMRRDHPDLPAEGWLAREVVDRYRVAHVEDLLREERGELSELDRQVAASLAAGAMVSADTEADYSGRRTLGERWADKLAEFGGSWWFLIVFAAVMAAWMAWNVAAGAEVFDPYPFILLNLMLSCLAAVQAPIIMMSQKRQEAKDRLRALNDYRVNLKAELEIRHLHEKLDHLLSKQWERLAEIQEMQIELMQERPAGNSTAPAV